jgi:hypothetical protein
MKDVFVVRSRRPLYVLSGLLAAGMLSCVVSPQSTLFWGCAVARADEFATVPAGDVLYKHLTAVQRAGWSGVGRGGATASDAQLLTRYEMALETARVYFFVTAQQRANANWQSGASRPVARSLRELVSALRVELRKLDIDTNAALAFCDAILQSGNGTINLSSRPVTAPVANTTQPSAKTRPNADALRPAAANEFAASTEISAIGVALPLSQRLRLHATLSSLAREADDPFGDTAQVSGHVFSASSSRPAPRVSSTTGAAYDVGNWLRLRADYENRTLLPNATDPSNLLNSSSSLNTSPLLLRALNANAVSGRSLGGGVDIELWRGLTVSGEVARVGTNDGSEAVRYGGGVGLTAWQNRLSLSANLSRLVPQEDSAVFSTTAAALNLDVGMTERLKLRLLYQQLFGASSQSRSERIVAGGLNISF